MKTNPTASPVLAFIPASGLRGQEASPEIAGLEKTVGEFVVAFLPVGDPGFAFDRG